MKSLNIERLLASTINLRDYSSI